MDDFAGYATDDNEKAGSTEEELESRKGRVSVNFADEGPVNIPSRTESRDTDTESFTYEHFPVVCPTCRGTGRVHQDDVNELVAFIPVKDERLRPSRIFWKLLLMFLICTCIAAPLAFVLTPRSVEISVNNIKSLEIRIPSSKNLSAYIIVETNLKIQNQNYLTVKITEIHLQVFWNKILLNHGLCNQNMSFTVPSRDSIERNLNVKIYFQGNKPGTAGFQIRDMCGDGWYNHILAHFLTTAKVSYLAQSSQISFDAYPYLQCYNYSGIEDSMWNHKRKKRMHQLPVKLTQ
eukprot:gene14275-5306_t